MQVLDRRTGALGGQSRWIRSNLEVCAKPSAFVTHDWMLVVNSALPYVLRGVDPDHPHRLQSVLQLQQAVRDVLSVESPHDVENRGELNMLKLTLLEALVEFERHSPLAEKALCFHYFSHMPDFIHRWGSARSLWSFFGERYTIWSRCKQQ